MNVKYLLTLREENNLQSSISFMTHYIKERCVNKHAVHQLCSVPVTTGCSLPPALLCCFRLQRKSAHFECLANLSLHLWFLYMKENKIWHIFMKTLCTLKCIFARWLHLSRWKTVHVGESIPPTSLSHSHKTRKASKQRERGICQCNCNQLFLCCPEETKMQFKVAQRLLFLATFVCSTNSI